MTSGTEHSPGKDPPEPPHGIVEELKQEVGELGHAVGEAVERVPQPVRWTVRKLVLLAAAAVSALVGIALGSAMLYFAHRTAYVEDGLLLVVTGDNDPLN